MRLRAFLDDRRDENGAAPEVFAAELYGFCVVRVMQPQGAHHRQSGVGGFAGEGVVVGQQPVAQFEIFFGDGFDLGVVQFGAVHVGVVFHRAVIARVPTPRQAQLPRSPVGTERRAEGGELKPARVEFTGEFARGIEASGVAAPERREAQAVVQPDGDVRGERLPFAVDVARPNPTAVTLRTRVAGAMKTPRADVRTVL